MWGRGVDVRILEARGQPWVLFLRSSRLFQRLSLSQRPGSSWEDLAGEWASPALPFPIARILNTCYHTKPFDAGPGGLCAYEALSLLRCLPRFGVFSSVFLQSYREGQYMLETSSFSWRIWKRISPKQWLKNRVQPLSRKSLQYTGLCLSSWLGRREPAISPFLFRKWGQSTTSGVSRDGFPCPNKRTMPPQGSNTIEKRLTFLLADCIKGKFCLGSRGPSLSFLSFSFKREIKRALGKEPAQGKNLWQAKLSN